MRIPILMYHGVEPESSDYLTIGVEQFDRQIAHLAEAYSPVRLSEVIQRLSPSSRAARRATPLPDNPVLVSFDDAYRNNLEYAVPILRRHEVWAIFFVITSQIGGTNRWNHKARRILDHMNREELLQLHDAGFELGSHTVTHQRLSKLPTDEIESELRDSARTLAEVTGERPTAISYPYGDADERCRDICANHYDFGFGTVRDGVFDWREQATQIRRIYVGPNDSAVDLDRKIACYRNGVQHD